MSRFRFVIVTSLLCLLVAGAFTVSVGWGAVSVPPAHVMAVFLSKAGFHSPIDVPSLQANVLWSIRVPRVMMSLIVGAALAVSGVVLQGVFRNPLAEPSLLGIAGGGVIGSMAALIVNSGTTFLATAVDKLGIWGQPLAGFVGALIVSVGLYAFFQREPRQDVSTFLLTGVIANVILGALMTLLPALFRDSGLGEATFWTMGGLGGTLWPAVHAAAPPILITIFWLWRMTPKLNVLALGDTDAGYLGVDTTGLRLQSVTLVALITGAAVAFAGVIAFVGLVVPHALRLVIGPDHRRLLPTAALGGAFVVCVADWLSRLIVFPSELPVGVLTTLIGGPLFFWQLYRARATGQVL